MFGPMPTKELPAKQTAGQKPSEKPAQIPPMSRSAAFASDLLNHRRDLRHLNVHLTRAVIGLSAALCLSLALNLVQLMTPAKRTYFATEPNGSIIPLVPLSTPIMTDSALLDWTARSLTRAFTLTWSNYRADEEGALPAFTTQAQADYLAGLENYKIIQLLTNQGENLSCVVSAAPVITQKGVESNGTAYWVIQVPLIWTYSAGGTGTQATSTQSVIARVLVVRAPETQAPDGLLISQINVQQAS
jgi:intracellular multiplication protein IcmL